VVAGDAIKPCAELRLTPEFRQSFDGLEQDFLDGILGIGAAMEHTEGKIEEPGKMAREEKFELITAAGLRADYEFFVRVSGGVLKEGVMQCFRCGLHGKPLTVKTIWIGLCDSCRKFPSMRAGRNCNWNGRE
jgi:hypothetical protein